MKVGKFIHYMQEIDDKELVQKYRKIILEINKLNFEKEITSENETILILNEMINRLKKSVKLLSCKV